MPWFRLLKKRKDETATPEVAEEVVPPAEEPEDPSDEDAAEGDAQRKRRRRGSRGGRNRKRSSADGAAAVAEPEPRKEAEAKAGDERSQRRSRQPQRERRRPPRRAPLPAAKRELLISVDVGEQRVAVVEDGKVAEVYLERPERRSIAGNIYLGTVDNVLPGMEAAFVEIGLEKNGFLYVDEIVVPELEGKRHGKKITDLIQRGQTLLVQAVKDPMKTKGARLTTEISLPGRFLVYVPYGEGLGVSRRLDESERTRMKSIIKGLDVTEGGVIVRTAAEGASAEDVERDFVFLQRLWKTIQARAKTAKSPELVYHEAELPLRIVRDLFAGGFEAAYVDNDRAHRRIVGYLKKTSPSMLERVHRYKEKEPLFEKFGVEREIASTLERRVDLPSGGYLIFDYAEAFTVIDVNTGRFVGSRSKSSTQRLEDTIVKNNLEAVKEVVRQLRLRDIGGIIVIDFIDMANPKNRQAVEEALRQELERDRTKTYVVEISPLGLVEMTRQNVTDGPREVMTRKCPTCAGDGIVVADATTAMVVERKLRELVSGGARGVQAYTVAVHPRILSYLAGSGGSRLLALEEITKRRIFLVEAEGHVHTDHLTVIAEGKTADLEPAAPFAAGSEIELKLVEVGLHDAAAGAGTHEGVTVTVADAAGLVGKKARVRIGLVLGGQAFGTLAEAKAAPEPITFESEAEKPTRAPARRKAVAPGEPAADGDVHDGVTETAEPEDDHLELDADGVDAAEEEAGGDETPVAGAPVKKRTRRGSRGGRRRKRPAGEAAADGTVEGEDESTAGAVGEGAPPAGEVTEGAEDVEVDDDNAAAARPARPPRRRTPKIHVPGDVREDADDGSAAGVEIEVEVGVAEVAEAAEGGEGGEDAAAAAARKRTRRGSRGGRNRKRKAGPTANGEMAEDERAAGSGDPAGESGDGREGVEAAREDGGEQLGAEEPGAVAPPMPVAVEAAAPSDDGGYVPMSEWIDDFDRSR